MVIFANSILVNSIIVLIIKAKVSKPTCEVSACFISSISKNLTKSFGSIAKRIYICTRRIFKLYIII